MIKNTIKSFLIFLLLELPINAFSSDLAIINVKIINPTEKIKSRLGYIILHNNKIKQVGYGQFKILSNAKIYDAKKQYIIPGLIDSHNHIDTILGLDGQQNNLNKNLLAAYQNQLPRSYLYFGYTTIIDLATTDKKAIHSFNAGKLHPDLYTCGGGIMIANGYPMNNVSEEKRYAIFPDFLYEPGHNLKLANNINPAQHTPFEIIKRIVNRHGVCVKIFYESGFGSDKNLPLPSLAGVKEIVRLAHKNNLPVIIHANSYSSQKFVLNSGADIFAHGLWNWGSYDGNIGIPLPIQKNILDKIISRHLGYQPTMQVINGLYELADPSFLDDPQLLKVIPKSLLTWYRTNEGQWYAYVIIGNSKILTIQKHLHSKQDQIKRVVNYLQKHNANLLFGSDTPSSPTYGNPPGYNGYLEMQDWYHANVSLSEILRAATIRNAKFFHLDKDYGSIAPGKFANLVLMKKNPLKDISAYDSITSVIIHGQKHDRSEFLANGN